ncbi:MAG: hypothetical protein R3E95_01460, partial [Thiolinea sp.]
SASANKNLTVNGSSTFNNNIHVASNGICIWNGMPNTSNGKFAHIYADANGNLNIDANVIINGRITLKDTEDSDQSKYDISHVTLRAVYSSTSNSGRLDILSIDDKVASINCFNAYIRNAAYYFESDSVNSMMYCTYKNGLMVDQTRTNSHDKSGRVDLTSPEN